MSEGTEKLEAGKGKIEAKEEYSFLSPNVITLLRIFLLPLPCALLFLEGYLAKIFSLGLGSLLGFTDYIDGALARKQRKVTKIGAMLDPVADKIFVTVVYLTFVYLGYFPFLPVALLMGRELLVAFLRSWFPEELRVINISRLKTAFQMLLAGIALLVSLADPSLLPLIHYALWGLVFLSYLSALPYLYRVRRVLTRVTFDPPLFARSFLSLAFGLTLLTIFPVSEKLFPIIQLCLSLYFFRKGLAKTSPFHAQQESALIVALLGSIYLEIALTKRVFLSLFLVLSFSLYRDGIKSVRLIWEILKLR